MQKEPPTITIRHQIKSGDIGYVLYLHGLLCGEEYGLDHTFEADVAASLAEFYSSFNPRRDRLWLAEKNGQILGSIAIVGRSKSEAQLRWYLIHPSSRGLGLGKTLLDEAIKFCRGCNYQTIYLWTFDELIKALALYKRAGFELAEEKLHSVWGRNLREQRYLLKL